MPRLSLLLVFVLLAVGAVPATGAEGTSISCTLGFGGVYCPERWIPVLTRLQNSTDQDITGYIYFPPGRDSGVMVREPVHVPPHSKVATNALLFPGIDTKGKKTDAGTITLALWHAGNATEMDRTTVPGIRLSSLQTTQSSDVDQNLPGVLVLTAGPQMDLPGPTLAEMVQVLGGMAAADQSCAEANQLPRTLVAYQSYPYVVLKSAADDLDYAQRAALLDHIRQGATLVIPNPSEESRLPESWLAPYLPVQIVGHRLAWQVLPIGETEAIKFSALLSIPEAVATDDPDAMAQSLIVLQDGNFVHAAVRRFGLGRIIFTSFEVPALSSKDGRWKSVWRRLLGLGSQTEIVRGTAEDAGTVRRGQMSAMLGRPAPTWTVAASVVGGYLLLVLATQGMLSGVRRPTAFVTISCVGVLTTVALIGITWVHHGSDPVSGARLSTIELSDDGQGRTTDLYAFFGRNEPGLQLSAAAGTVVAQPLDFDPKDPPTLLPRPFTAPDAGARADGISRIWQASDAFPASKTLKVTGRFGPTGLVLQSSSSFDSPVRAPVLAWGPRTVRLVDLAPGAQSCTAAQGDLNPIGVYTNTSGVVGSIDHLRNQMAMDSLGQSAGNSFSGPDLPPQVLGWLDPASVAPLLDVKAGSAMDMHSQMLLRVPLRLQPSPVGSMVHVDGPFNRLERAGNSSPMPADRYGRITSGTFGDWVLAVCPPGEIGTIRPTHATFFVDLDAPQHVVTLQAQQFNHPSNSGPLSENTAAPLLATWSHAVGMQSVSFDVTPGDLTPEGYLAVRLAVNWPPGTPQAAGYTQWSFHSLSVALDGQVTGGPVTQPLEREAVEQPPSPASTQPVIPRPKKKAPPKSTTQPKKPKP